ncbi:hypothetical protein F2Q69_00003928 [Brassica cretica]|uniref:F-box associated beta-propeller type 1 domain-containing protein n=1 Tax=Brassica cretica TaxID=69181 RepID=A0A8S9P8C6_BRACR|nr:hypothetical protein F2Q69_00003928 [Brassica cretica]
MATTISDLPEDLVTEILSRVSLTYAGSMFLGFMVIDSKLCSMKLDLQGTRNNGNLVYRPTTKRADICKVFHWDGLLLCVTKSRLVVWNPYLRQIKWIQPMDKLLLGDMYGVGYENNNNNNRNHKILRLLNYSMWSELAESFGQRLVLPFGACVRFSKTVVLSCVRDEQLAVLHHGKDDRLMDIWITTRIEPNVASWSRFLRVEMRPFRAYIIEEHGNIKNVNIGKARDPGNKLVFSSYAPTERFGQRIVLPFGACVSFSKTVVLSRVRDEQLAVLHQLEDNNVMEFWITSKIEPNAASWTRFLRVEMTPFRFVTESFYIDEEKKVALVSGFLSSATAATMESPAPAPGTSSATVAFPVVGSIVGASLSAFLALLLQ